MRSQRLRRFVLAAIIAAWGYPVVAALSVGVHLAAHHVHDENTISWTRAMVHGHEHDLNVPAHRHDATIPDSSSCAVASSVNLANAGTLQALAAPLGVGARLELHPTHSPPEPATRSPLRL